MTYVLLTYAVLTEKCQRLLVPFASSNRVKEFALTPLARGLRYLTCLPACPATIPPPVEDFESTS